jgi:hypothetical protein
LRTKEGFDHIQVHLIRRSKLSLLRASSGHRRRVARVFDQGCGEPEDARTLTEFAKSSKLKNDSCFLCSFREVLLGTDRDDHLLT